MQLPHFHQAVQHTISRKMEPTPALPLLPRTNLREMEPKGQKKGVQLWRASWMNWRAQYLPQCKMLPVLCVCILWLLKYDYIFYYNCWLILTYNLCKQAYPLWTSNRGALGCTLWATGSNVSHLSHTRTGWAHGLLIWFQGAEQCECIFMCPKITCDTTELYASSFV